MAMPERLPYHRQRPRWTLVLMSELSPALDQAPGRALELVQRDRRVRQVAVCQSCMLRVRRGKGQLAPLLSLFCGHMVIELVRACAVGCGLWLVAVDAGVDVDVDIHAVH